MKKVLIGEDVKRTLMVVAASVFSAWNINTCVHAAGRLPGGFTGLSLLLQECFAAFLHLAVPYSAINVILNCIPAAISFKFIGKKFTGFSVLSIVLTGLLVDMLLVAGALFGWTKAMYSIIFQFTSTQVLHGLYRRYQKETLFVITEWPDEVYQAIRDTTHHDATLFKGIGLYLYKPRKMVYSVVSREEARTVVAAIRQVDPKAFINAVSTDQVTGRFYQKPKD